MIEIIALLTVAWIACGAGAWYYVLRRYIGGWRRCSNYDAFMIFPSMIAGPIFLGIILYDAIRERA